MKPITYISEQPEDYARELSACGTRAELVLMLSEWTELAADALVIAAAMTQEEWPEFRRGLRSERRGKFAGEEWAEKYAAILMPEVMFKASAIASRYKVPFGLAYIRMREAEKRAHVPN